ncbi:hypothetical protein Gasu2_61460 [Galdieria sulphuraria]|nr:hypothetical protein Gasu2_61460 [Galdieria sulphuraria]
MWEIRECSKPPNDNALKVSSKQQSLEKLKTTNDDLLELLSGVNISQQWHSSGFASSEQSLVPPMQEGKFPQQLPFRETLQQQWHDVDTPSQFENLQVRGMNMTSMFPTRQGIIFPNMIMTPYMTYGGPGTWSAPIIVVWVPELLELIRTMPIWSMMSKFASNSPSEYDSTQKRWLHTGLLGTFPKVFHLIR